MKALTLAIVIPVYNEEHHLEACLQAIARQTEKPDQVIVVDNNSTDGTMAIAQSFPFVTIIHEPVQGLIAARNTGLDYAKTDVVARIDADARISPDWVKAVKASFTDPHVMGVTGLAYTLTIHPERGPKTRLWPLMYFWFIEADFGIPVLWGANMALRRTAWQKIRSDVCRDDTLVHEDQDLSYLMAGRNLPVVRNNRMLMTTTGESYHEWAKFSEYMHRREQTRQYHNERKTLQFTRQRLPLLARAWRAALVMIPGIPFILTSYPISLVASAYTRLLQEFAPPD